MNENWIVPDWPTPTGVKALVTTRAGGVSTGPYASLNLGFSSGDDAHAVEQNRARLREHLPGDPRWLKQVHGTRVVAAESVGDRPEADASVAHEAGIVCAILVADCLPVLFTDTAGTVVAAAHAGWRGLAYGVLENTVEAMRASTSRDLLAYIGPGIGSGAFEVGSDVYEAFTARDASARAAFRRHSATKWLADLSSLARQTLGRCGVSRVYGGGFCTHSDPGRFYSYRRDRVTGRMAALIWREG